MSDWDTEVDVLVVGAGGAGLAAAIAAHDAGAVVAITEKLDRVGGNTALSTGSLPGAGTRFQRAAGIEDSPERMVADLRGLSGSHDADELLEVLAAHSAEIVEWLADSVGVKLDVIVDYRHVAHSVPRLHAPASRKGQDLADQMLAAVERRAIPLATSSPVRSLRRGSDGRITGAVTANPRGAQSSIRASKIVLCVNGFGASRELLRLHCPEVADLMYVGAKGSEGEAIRWGEEVGARFGNMASYQGYATVLYPHGELLSWTTIEKGAIVVNAHGNRFADESVGYSGFTAAVARAATPTVAIFDQTIIDIAAREPWFKEVLDYGGAKRAADLGQLAAASGLSQAALEATLATYHRAAKGEIPDPWGRTDFGLAPLQAPFWYARVVPALLSTQGGLAVDSRGRVLRPDSTPVPNLFAAGGAVAGIAGRSGGRGYASGTGLLHAIGLGFIAGRAAVADLSRGEIGDHSQV
jgi:fumarate reductase flavoprotein subunit